MTQVVLRGGGFLPMTPMAAAPEGNVKQAEPEKEDIMVMDTKLKIIEILQVWDEGRKVLPEAPFPSALHSDGAQGVLSSSGRDSSSPSLS